MTTVAGRSRRTVELARDLELLSGLDEVVAESDVVLSIVPPGEARSAARAICGSAARTGAHPLVADLNAIAPATARALADELLAAGLDAVDGAISGRPPTAEGTTTVYLSGARADEIASLPAPGIRWRVVGGTPGLASAVKMSTASFYKGQAAVLLQALRAAHRNGVLDPVLEDLRASVPDLVERSHVGMQRLAAVSGRYVGEMREIAAAQRSVGLPPSLFEGMAEVYAELSRSALAEAAPEDLDDGLLLREVLERL